jgi:Carboxypeptidase regulatory-like domain
VKSRSVAEKRTAGELASPEQVAISLLTVLIQIKSSNRIRGAFLVAAALMFCVLPALAQINTGEIDGFVQDPSGAVIAGAMIAAVESSTHLKYTTRTNASGEFLLAQLPVGEYALTVNVDGFKQAVQSRIPLHAGDHLRQAFTMELGDQSDTVIISAAPGLLQVESAAIRDTVEQQQVINLPLKGRQFIDLVGTTPGITHAPSGTRGGALQQTGQTWGILGQRGGHNLYLVDGVSVTDEYYNNLVLNPSVDSIREFSVDQTSYNAEFGGKSGGVVNVITKSGSNQFHGSLFEFVRNDVFNAKNFFNSPTQPNPPFKQNQFGGSFGGPIQRDKTFFFVSYEGQRTHQSLTRLLTVPTDAERAGNFTGTGITVTNPDTGTPFANDTIPTIDPVAAAILAKVPHANLPGFSRNLLATNLSTFSINQYNLRIDHTFSDKDSVFVRGSIFDANQFNPFGISALNETLLPGFGYDLRTHTDNLSATWNHIFNTSWINELRFGWLWVGGGQSSPNAGTDLSGSTGLQGVTSNPLDRGYPQAVISGGYATMGEPTQYVSRRDNNYELYDNVIWHHGTHTVKFGVYFFHLDFEPVNANNARGLFTFTGGYTAQGTNNGLGDFLLGLPTQGQVGVGGRGELLGRTNWLHTYLEDSWQILPGLKLDIGLRYEYNQNVTDANNNMSVVNTLVPGGQFVIASNAAGDISPAASALLSQIPIPYVTSAQAGWDSSLLQARPLRLAPRIGLAWTLPDQKTVIRSGFGIYTNQAAYSIIQNAALNLPFYFAKTVANSASCAGAVACNMENILAASPTGTVSASNVKHDFKIEYNNVWNLSIQRKLSSSTSFQAQYIGSYTVHADNLTLQNLFPNNGLDPASGLHVRPIPEMSGFPSVTWDGWEKYHALTLTFTQRIWHGLTVDTNYTWSKALDDASNPGTNNAGTNLPQDIQNIAAEKGLSDFDHRHRFVTSFLYHVPFLSDSEGWIHTAFADWQVGGIWTLESGSPFTVNLSTDNANNGMPLSAPSQRPNLVCNPNNGPKTTAEWFDTSCFVTPAQYTYGNAGRSIVTGPGINNFDATFQKNFSIHEDTQLQFRADIFDFFNHPNFNQPNRIFTSTPSAFGSISSAQDPRVMQFSLRLAF